MRSCQWLWSKNKNKGEVKPEGKDKKKTLSSTLPVWSLAGLPGSSCGRNCGFWVSLLHCVMTPQRRVQLLEVAADEKMLMQWWKCSS